MDLAVLGAFARVKAEDHHPPPPAEPLPPGTSGVRITITTRPDSGLVATEEPLPVATDSRKPTF